MTTTRRFLLAALPALAAAPASAASTGDDPVIDIVTRYRQARKRWEAAVSHWFRVEEEHGRGGEDLHPATIAKNASDDAHDALDRVTVELVDTPPTTVAGVRAVLQLLAERFEEEDRAGPSFYAEELSKLLAGLAGTLHGS